MEVELTLKDGEFILTFPYDEVLVCGAKRVPGARWSKKHKHWHYPATPMVYAKLKEIFNLTLEEVEQELIVGTVKLPPLKTEPFQHQREAMDFILKQFNLKAEEI